MYAVTVVHSCQALSKGAFLFNKSNQFTHQPSQHRTQLKPECPEVQAEPLSILFLSADALTFTSERYASTGVSWSLNRRCTRGMMLGFSKLRATVTKRAKSAASLRPLGAGMGVLLVPCKLPHWLGPAESAAAVSGGAFPELACKRQRWAWWWRERRV